MNRLPLLLSFCYLQSEPSPRQDKAAAAAHFAKEVGASGLGVNCGVNFGMKDMLEVVTIYRQETDLPVFVRPNAGSPGYLDYPRSPQYLAEKLWPLLEAGVTM